jgi:hypothetical protein
VVHIFVANREQADCMLDKMRAKLHFQKIAERLDALLSLLDRAAYVLEQERFHLQKELVSHAGCKILHFLYHLQHHAVCIQSHLLLLLRLVADHVVAIHRAHL